MIPVSTGEEYIIHIDSVAARGSGVGRVNGFTVFVPHAAGGDIARVRITRAKKSFAEGELIELLEPSPDRVVPDCPHYPACGGCGLRHVSYAAQLEYKRGIVENAMRRIGGFTDFSLGEIIAADNTSNYRNKAVFRAGYNKGRVVFGFNSAKTHNAVPADGCLICGAGFTEIAAAAAGYARENNVSVFDGRRGILKSLFVRSSRKTGKIAVVISVNAAELPREDELVRAILSASGAVSGIMLEHGGKTRVLYGEETLTEEILGIDFTVSPQSFLQVNPEQTAKLYGKALEFADIRPEDKVMDLYCGIGTLTLIAAKTAKYVTGVEKSVRAIQDARKNAEINGIENAEFFAAGAEEIVPGLISRGEKPDIVMLDPPRAGSDAKTLSAICAAEPDKIVYVSCDSASLARDLRFICERGYSVKASAAVDMFPHTAHIETVCLLSKLNVNQHIEVELTMDEMDLTAAEKKAGYEEIKAYVLEKFGMKVSHLYIAQVKRKCGIIERENYNKPKSEDSRRAQCQPEKEASIMEALKHFGMI